MYNMWKNYSLNFELVQYNIVTMKGFLLNKLLKFLLKLINKQSDIKFIKTCFDTVYYRKIEKDIKKQIAQHFEKRKDLHRVVIFVDGQSFSYYATNEFHQRVIIKLECVDAGFFKYFGYSDKLVIFTSSNNGLEITYLPKPQHYD